jgi:hypothetical protein
MYIIYLMYSDDVVCGYCRTYALRNGSIGDTTTSLTTTITPVSSASRETRQSEPEYQQDQLNMITVTIPRSISTNQACVVCKKTKNIVDIPDTVYIDAFVKKNIIIPNGGKCRKTHLNRKNTFHKKDLDHIEIVSNQTTLTDYEVKIILDRIRHLSSLTLLDKFNHTVNLNDNDCKAYTGFSKDQFISIFDSIRSMRDSPNRNKTQALATYLFWLKSGLDYRTIASIFSIDNFQRVGDYCESVRKALLNDFVPTNLGPNHMSRDEWVTQNSLIPKKTV